MEKKKIDFKIYNSFWEHIGENKHCGACGALLFTMDCSHLVCFIYIFLVLSSSFLNANAVMLNGKLSEWRFFVNSSELWSFIYLSSFIRICSYTSLLCFNNLCEQWVVDFLGPSMSVTCPATLGSLRLKISFTRSVLPTFFLIQLVFAWHPNWSKRRVSQLQYGRIVDIELKVPPRPPCYCFVEVRFFVLNYMVLTKFYKILVLVNQALLSVCSLSMLGMRKTPSMAVMATTLTAVAWG